MKATRLVLVAAGLGLALVQTAPAAEPPIREFHDSFKPATKAGGGVYWTLDISAHMADGSIPTSPRDVTVTAPKGLYPNPAAAGWCDPDELINTNSCSQDAYLGSGQATIWLGLPTIEYLYPDLEVYQARPLEHGDPASLLVNVNDPITGTQYVLRAQLTKETPQLGGQLLIRGFVPPAVLGVQVRFIGLHVTTGAFRTVSKKIRSKRRGKDGKRRTRTVKKRISYWNLPPDCPGQWEFQVDDLWADGATTHKTEMVPCSR